MTQPTPEMLKLARQRLSPDDAPKRGAIRN